MSTPRLQPIPKTTPRRSQDGPKTIPRRSQDDPKTIPRRPQDDPKTISRRPPPRFDPHPVSTPHPPHRDPRDLVLVQAVARAARIPGGEAAGRAYEAPSGDGALLASRHPATLADDRLCTRRDVAHGDAAVGTATSAPRIAPGRFHREAGADAGYIPRTAAPLRATRRLCSITSPPRAVTTGGGAGTRGGTLDNRTATERLDPGRGPNLVQAAGSRSLGRDPNLAKAPGTRGPARDLDVTKAAGSLNPTRDPNLVQSGWTLSQHHYS